MSWFSILLVFSLAWLFGDLFRFLFALLGIIFGPIIVAALITALIPQIPVGVAYFGVLIFILMAVWKECKNLRSSVRASTPAVRPVDRLTLSSSERHELPREEQEFIDGCRAIVLGQDETALLHFKKVLHLADGAFLAGVVALKMNRLAEATEFLSSITERECALDRHISKAGISVAVRLPISEEVSTEVNPDVRGVLLALSQAYLKQKRWRDALVQLQRLRRIQPYDTATKLAMAEWHLKARPGDRQAFAEVVGLAEGIEGESEVEAALLLDKTKALRGLGRIAGPLTTLVALHGKRKYYSEEFNEAVARERKALLATKESSS